MMADPSPQREGGQSGTCVLGLTLREGCVGCLADKCLHLSVPARSRQQPGHAPSSPALSHVPPSWKETRRLDSQHAPPALTPSQYSPPKAGENPGVQAPSTPCSNPTPYYFRSARREPRCPAQSLSLQHQPRVVSPPLAPPSPFHPPGPSPVSPMKAQALTCCPG